MTLPVVLMRALLIWLFVIAAETIHGILWGILLVPIVGDLPARQIGVLVGSLLIFMAASPWLAAWLRGPPAPL